MTDVEATRPKTDAARTHSEIQKVLRDEIASLQSTLEDRFKELGALTKQLELIETQADTELDQQVDSLKKRHALEMQLVHVLYASWQNGPAQGVPEFGQQIEALSQTELFNPEWYLAAYPDVVESGMSPKEHYVRSGAFEGRNPGPDFDTMAYYMANPDIAEMGWPGLVHYALFGQAEGRPVSL